MQSPCTLRTHCRQWPRNTRYQADATPYLDRTSTGWIAPALPGALTRSPHLRRGDRRRTGLMHSKSVARFGAPERAQGVTRLLCTLPGDRGAATARGRCHLVGQVVSGEAHGALLFCLIPVRERGAFDAEDKGLVTFVDHVSAK